MTAPKKRSRTAQLLAKDAELAAQARNIQAPDWRLARLDGHRLRIERALALEAAMMHAKRHAPGKLLPTRRRVLEALSKLPPSTPRREITGLLAKRLGLTKRVVQAHRKAIREKARTRTTTRP